MRATAWNNGAHHASGAGYGLKVSVADRDRYFGRDWSAITLEIPGRVAVSVPVAESFWRRCSELRSAELGRWLRDEGLAPWTKGQPPVLQLEKVEDNRFRVRTDG